jgi:hypothetical protein
MKAAWVFILWPRAVKPFLSFIVRMPWISRPSVNAYVTAIASPLFLLFDAPVTRSALTTVVRHTKTPIRCPYVARCGRHQSPGPLVHSVDRLRKPAAALIVMLLAYASAGCDTTANCSFTPRQFPSICITRNWLIAVRRPACRLTHRKIWPPQSPRYCRNAD